MGLSPDGFTAAQLVAMYQGHQKDRYDHTVAILNAWSKTPVKNPHRTPKFVPMQPSELYAMQAAIERRKNQ